MARDVKILHQTYLPGGGFTSSGKPKQGKSMVVGRIDVTSYTTNGETLTANDMGLNTVDVAVFGVEDVNSQATTSVPGIARWDASAETLVVFDTGTTQASSGETVTIGFFAAGDSARDVETLA